MACQLPAILWAVVRSIRRQNLVNPLKPFKTSLGSSVLGHSLVSDSLFSCLPPRVLAILRAVVQSRRRQNLVNLLKPFKTNHGRSQSVHSSASDSLFSRLHLNVFRYPASSFPVQMKTKPSEPLQALQNDPWTKPIGALLGTLFAIQPLPTNIGQFPDRQCEDLF